MHWDFILRISKEQLLDETLKMLRTGCGIQQHCKQLRAINFNVKVQCKCLEMFSSGHFFLLFCYGN